MEQFVLFGFYLRYNYDERYQAFRRIILKHIPTVLLILSILCIASCSKRMDNESSEQSRESGFASVETGTEPERTLNFGESRQSSSEHSAPIRQTKEEDGPGMKRTEPFLYYIGTKSHIPRDLVIGSLLQTGIMDDETRKIKLLIENWLFSLKKSDTRDNLEQFYSSRTWELTGAIRETTMSFSSPIVQARLGSIQFENGTARMDIRLFSDIGRAEGEIVFVLQNNSWKILSENIDYQKLDMEYRYPDYSGQSEVFGTFQM